MFALIKQTAVNLNAHLLIVFFFHISNTGATCTSKAREPWMPHLSATRNVIGARNRIYLAETNGERKRNADCLSNVSFAWPMQYKCHLNSSSNSSSDPVVINENLELDQHQVEVIIFQLLYIKMYLTENERSNYIQWKLSQSFGKTHSFPIFFLKMHFILLHSVTFTIYFLSSKWNIKEDEVFL